jgi:hypothetical protein
MSISSQVVKNLTKNSYLAKSEKNSKKSVSVSWYKLLVLGCTWSLTLQVQLNLNLALPATNIKIIVLGALPPLYIQSSRRKNLSLSLVFQNCTVYVCGRGPTTRDVGRNTKNVSNERPTHTSVLWWWEDSSSIGERLDWIRVPSHRRVDFFRWKMERSPLK